MPLAHQEGFRKGLLPKWVRFFAWIFLVMGSAMPTLLVSGIFYPNPMQFSLFGWEHSGSPYDLYSLLVVAYFAASGVAAFGMLWGPGDGAGQQPSSWAPLACCCPWVRCSSSR